MITSTYRVQCDICFGFLDGEYGTGEAAEQARQDAGWEGPNYGDTLCPDHNPQEQP